MSLGGKVQLDKNTWLEWDPQNLRAICKVKFEKIGVVESKIIIPWSVIDQIKSGREPSDVVVK